MSLVTRTASIQVRVAPLVKQASEQVLWSMGLNMSEAVELFLRRVIVDQAIPFQIVALPSAQETYVDTTPAMPHRERGVAKKEIKKFLGTRTSPEIRRANRRKKRPN